MNCVVVLGKEVKLRPWLVDTATGVVAPAPSAPRCTLHTSGGGGCCSPVTRSGRPNRACAVLQLSAWPTRSSYTKNPKRSCDGGSSSCGSGNRKCTGEAEGTRRVIAWSPE